MSVPKDTFTLAESAELARLLKKVQANGGWFPTPEVYREINLTVSRWAVELVLTNSCNNGMPSILLSRYDGAGVPEHKGLFHIAGGFERFSESIQETCSRVAKSELGVDVVCGDILGVHKWTSREHPWGSRLLSLYVSCSPLKRVHTHEGRRFFSAGEVLSLDQTDMDQKHPHRKFALGYLARIETRRIHERIR